MLIPVTNQFAIGAAGGGFSPLDIAGLVEWWDASDAATITESSGSVSQWDGKSGNGYDLTQGTGGAQPTTGTRTQNSLNVLDFDNDYLASAGVAVSQPFSVLAVAKYDVTNADGRIFSTNGGTDVQGGDASGGYGRFMFAGSIFAGSAEDTSPHYYTYTFNGASSSIRVDGGVDGSGNAGTSNLNGLGVGARKNAGDLSLNGVIGEILIYSSLSTTDRDALEAYLAAKWAI